MKAAFVLCLALLAVTAVSAEKGNFKKLSGEWNTALGQILTGDMDPKNTGGKDQYCRSDGRGGMTCNDPSLVCTNFYGGQTPLCKKCGGSHQVACAGLMCKDGTKANDICPICPVVARKNPPPTIKAKQQAVRRQSRSAVNGGATGAAVSSASAAIADIINPDVAASVSKNIVPTVAPPPAATIEEEVVMVTASAAEAAAMVDMSSGALNRPCRTQELWPGLPACDGDAACQFAGNGSPGICL